jgi:hypothetical protein
VQGFRKGGDRALQKPITDDRTETAFFCFRGKNLHESKSCRLEYDRIGIEWRILKIRRRKGWMRAHGDGCKGIRKGEMGFIPKLNMILVHVNFAARLVQIGRGTKRQAARASRQKIGERDGIWDAEIPFFRMWANQVIKVMEPAPFRFEQTVG